MGSTMARRGLFALATPGKFYLPYHVLDLRLQPLSLGTADAPGAAPGLLQQEAIVLQLGDPVFHFYSPAHRLPDSSPELIHAGAYPSNDATCSVEFYASRSRDGVLRSAWSPFYSGSCIRTSMRRHCLSSRRGGPRSWPSAPASCPSRYASIRTFGEPALCGGSVHRMRSVFSGYLRRCYLPSGLSSCSRADRVRLRSRLLPDPKRYLGLKPWRVTTRPPFLRPRRCARITPSSSIRRVRSTKLRIASL